MLESDKIYEILEKALKWSTADHTQLVFTGFDHFLSRYANSQIHQNTAVKDNTLYVKTVKDNKIGVSSINSLDDESIRIALKSAMEAAVHQKPIPDFKGLPDKAVYGGTDDFYRRTAQINPEEKALVIKDMIDRAHGDRISLSGAFYTGTSQLAVANSNGLKAYNEGSLANIAVTASGADTSGFATASERDVDRLDHTLLIEEALESAKTYDRTITLEPGEYPVILEEYAVADLLIYLSWMAFTSEAAEDGSSFLVENRDKKMFGDHISIYDDGMNPDTFRMPFDYEGVPKKRVDFIKKGVVTGNVTYNSYGAGREGKESTGHALPPDMGLAVTEPIHTFIEPGEHTNEELLENLDRGLLIKRFHYLTTVHPLKTIVSGMTRDGVFFVEKGKITARVKNMRFTQSIVEALKNTKIMTKTRKKVWFREFTLDLPITTVVPRLLISKFNFTGQTDF